MDGPFYLRQLTPSNPPSPPPFDLREDLHYKYAPTGMHVRQYDGSLSFSLPPFLVGSSYSPVVSSSLDRVLRYHERYRYTGNPADNRLCAQPRALARWVREWLRGWLIISSFRVSFLSLFRFSLPLCTFFWLPPPFFGGKGHAMVRCFPVEGLALLFAVYGTHETRCNWVERYKALRGLPRDLAVCYLLVYRRTTGGFVRAVIVTCLIHRKIRRVWGLRRYLAALYSCLKSGGNNKYGNWICRYN